MIPTPDADSPNGTAPPRGSERLYELFHAAQQLSADERQSFLAQECGSDGPLRAELEELLRQDDRAQAEDFLTTVLSGALFRSPISFTSAQSLVGQRLGPYEIRAWVAGGGMGHVYRATRIDDYTQEVAIKVVRSVIASEELESRFQTERQILATLNHPNIARLLDGGTVDGLPYFVMEYIDGQPIDRHCEAQQLPLPERVRLLVQVCEAVAHAHQKGIVHRDLKPANVLVSADGTPKLTDFGLAKYWQAGDGQTRTGQILGTPGYMAPEQAGGNPDAVGPAADVYALGGILYHLMTARPPFKGASWQQTIQQVATVDPPRPRRLEPRLPRDLEAICLKCLEKDPTERYESVQELTEELRRFLRGEPVRARPLARLALVRRWCRRNPVVAGLLAVVAVLVVLGTTTAGYFAVEAVERAHDLALAKDEAEQHARAATRKAEEAQEAQRQAEEAGRLAEERRQRGEWLGYVGKLATAQREWYDNDVWSARLSLAQAPPEVRGWEYRYLHHRLHANQVVLASPRTDVRSVAWSPDERLVAAGHKDGSIKLWDVEKRSVRTTLSGHTGPVTGLAFTPDGGQLVSSSTDGTLRVWEAGKCIRTLSGHTRPVRSVAVTPDGRRFLSVGEDGTAKVWNGASGVLEVTLACEQGALIQGVFTGDGTQIVTGGASGFVKVWEVATGKNVVTSSTGHRVPVLSVAIGPNGKRMASGDTDGTIIIWDGASGRPLSRCYGHGAPIGRLRFAERGSKIVSASEDQTVRVWAANTGKQDAILRGHTGAVNDLAVGPGGERAVSVGSDGSVILWELQEEQDSVALGSHKLAINQVAISADGQRIASASHDQTVRLWGSKRGHPTLVFREHAAPVLCVTLTGDGKRVASGGDVTVKIWDAASGKTLHSLKGHTGGVCAVAFSPDGKTVASGSQDRTIKIWDAASGEERFTLRGHTNSLTGLAFSPDGKRLVSGSHDCTARVWDVATGEQVREMRPSDLLVVSVAWSPDGKWIAAATGNPFDLHWAGEVCVWDAESGREHLRLRGHTTGVGAVLFTPDGKRILTGGWDQTIRVWDTRFGLEALKIRGHSLPIVSLALDANGSRLAYAESDPAQAAKPGTIFVRETTREERP